MGDYEQNRSDIPAPAVPHLLFAGEISREAWCCMSNPNANGKPNTAAELMVDGEPLPRQRVLLVDDNESVLSSLGKILTHNGFEVSAVSSVNEALRLIGSQTFDVLLSDLHMPNAGDGLTVVSAMRHANPKAVTLIFSGYPEMNQAAAAILMQADEIMVKPMAPETLIQTIMERLRQGATPPRSVENVASILEAGAQSTIKEWLIRVNRDAMILTVPMNDEARCSYLTQLFKDLVSRLRNPLPLGSRAQVSPAAAAHGLARRKQGYTAAMMVEESRMLQVSIFQTLQNNLHQVDFSLLLVGVMAIADEVDSQLAQQMASYVAESQYDELPVEA